MIIETEKRRWAPDLLPAAVLAALLVAGQIYSGSEEIFSPPVSIPETVKTWVEVEYPFQVPFVRGYFSPPILADVIPGCGQEGEKPLKNGTRVRIISGQPLIFRLEKMPGSHLLLLGQKVDVNQAGRRDLEAVPGIGPSLSERILQYREEHGDFRELSGLLDIRGIGPKSLSKIREYLTINTND
ncbi:MAG: helix-hairpin-helix domain-containing protein [bacterium]|nr:helix-hairpin-helix domain-containing protein [bacterium]